MFVKLIVSLFTDTKKTRALTPCSYNTFCPGDPNAFGFEQGKTQYCAAVIPGSSTTTVANSALPSFSVITFPSTTASVSTTPTSTVTPASKNSAAQTSAGLGLLSLFFALFV